LANFKQQTNKMLKIWRL